MRSLLPSLADVAGVNGYSLSSWLVKIAVCKCHVEFKPVYALRFFKPEVAATGLRFDDALKVLSEREFFLSEERIMSIVRRKCREGGKIDLKPVPKVKKPRLRAEQLELLADL